MKRFTEMMVMLAAAAGLSIGLWQAAPAYAASAGPRNGGSVVRIIGPGGDGVALAPDGLAKSKSVKPKTSNGCSQFKGTLEYYTDLIGKNYEQQFVVDGHLYTNCSGGRTRLWAHYTCEYAPGATPSRKKITQETSRGKKKVDWESPYCSFSINNMYVEVCWHSKAGYECVDSAKLE
jgi:hypothetical protein